LVPYNPAWSGRYAQLADAIAAAVGTRWVVEHVGSTSVPGLLAKPVIDIAIRVPESEHLTPRVPAFRDLGWTDPLSIGNHQAMFLLDGRVRSAIAHVFTAEQWPQAHVRLFAGWLRAHRGDRDRYAALKSRLLAQGKWGSDYTKAKAEFVHDVVSRARATQNSQV
jgi:GrpB-like predicted nucleotidyltransferase (UPF0157 family)